MFQFALRLRTGATLQRFCLVLLLALGAPASLPIARANSDSTHAVMTAPAHQVCIAWTWRNLFAPAERLLGNQTNMIRFGVIAVFAALYIIWWRK